MRTPLLRFTFLMALAAAPSSPGAAQSSEVSSPRLVSPGARDGLRVAPSSCPTFSWGAPPPGHELELLVYQVSDEGAARTPVLAERLPAGSTAWTPSADRCLGPQRYAWTVRANGASPDNTEVFVFQVQKDRAAELEARIAALVDRPLAVETPTSGSPARAVEPSHQQHVTAETAAAGPRKIADAAGTPCGTFVDVDESSAFCQWVLAAHADNLLGPCATDPDSRFCPTAPVTRQQLAMAVSKVHTAPAGGALSGNYPNPDLAAAYRLPQGCGVNASPIWTGAQWACFQCTEADQCPGIENECQSRTCANSACGVQFVTLGTPVSQQAAGDCHQEECNGTGGTLSAVLISDFPDDGLECTIDACTSSGAPTHSPLPEGSACGPASVDTCDDQGGCVASPIPTHLPRHYLVDGTCDWTIASSAELNSDAFTAGGSALPAGCSTAVETIGGVAVAVIAVHSLTVPQSVTVTVRGSRPLVVVASQNISIDGIVDASATKATPGPGGATPSAGAGAGSAGVHSGVADVGGGGAGHGASGAGSGNSAAGLAGTSGGGANGDSELSAISAGSGGGNEADQGSCDKSGGAGGGYLQLSAGSVLSIGSTGRVAAGGGGGSAGGCSSAGGAGGGAGGGLYLEAITLVVSGGSIVAANGGGGGGANCGGTPSDGQDGLIGSTAASGGTGGSCGTGGGTGGSLASAAQKSASGLENTGGGGGGVGRIVLRSRGAPATGGATISPAATVLSDL